MTTKLTKDNLNIISNVGISWQSVITADGSTNTTAVAGRGYFIDTTSAAHTIILPSSPTSNDSIAIKDYAGTFSTNNLLININGNNIQGVANDSVISTNRASLTLVYVDNTKGWVYTDEHNVADLRPIFFTSATGGTITTSGDYKIHTFTGDGCFVVSTVGNGPTIPLGGPNTVSYLVVAGGGSGGGHAPGTSSSFGGGGGGAGGFREGRDITPSYTASPLVAPTGLTITQTTYPITVGAGGATNTTAYPNQGNPGSPSSFSTITSTGGGGGALGNGSPGSPGGSGGGDSANSTGPNNTGGTGNTPPVSPPQGNPGGDTAAFPNRGSSGGGGAGAAGTNNPSGNDGTPGGNGVTTSISASPTAYAGGGGGGGWDGSTKGNGGTGGGGNGGQSSDGCAGTANTGGGGGGSGPINVVGGGSAQDGGAGGKGIVIIRYKYQ